MRRISEPELAAWARERDERKNPRVLLRRSFRATVVAVARGVPGGCPYLVQVQRHGELDQNGNPWTDPHWHASDGQPVPQVGDVGDLQWRDDNVAWFVHGITSAPLVGNVASPSTLAAIPMFATGAPVLGTLPAVPRFLPQSGTVTPTTNASGDITIVFPQAFPLGILIVGCWPGDLAATLTSVAVNMTGMSLTGFNARCFSGATAINTLTVRVNWFAIGF